MNFINTRNCLTLNGKWDFRLDPGGLKTEEILSGLPYASWRTAPVPGDIAAACPEQPYYEGICWYRRQFTIPDNMKSKRLILHFEAVNYIACVYINGDFVGRNVQGFLPFEVDVTEYAEVGDNMVLVMVNNAVKPGQLPSVFYWRNAGGIIRDVYLYATEAAYIERAYVTAGCGGGAEFYITTSGDLPAGAILRVETTSPDGKNVRLANETATGEMQIPTSLEGARIWSPETPNLYKASVKLLFRNGKILDEVEIIYGYRTIAVADGQILLNGEPVFLKGFNRHEDSAQAWGAASHAIVDADFANVKASGANFIRMCHYPHDSYELDAADRLGLILLVEIPLNSLLIPWGTRISPEGQWVDQSFQSAMDALTRMIARDHSHPSVCIWSVSNECNEDVTIVNQINNTLVQLAKKLDPSRLCVHVSMFSMSDAAKHIFKYDDVICINTYTTASERTRAINNNQAYDIGKPQKTLRGLLARLKEYYPGKPIVMTEYGYATGHAYDGLEAEEAQEACIVSEYNILKECANGAALWIYADHLWPISYKETTMELSTFGALTRARKPKKAFETYSRLMKGED